MAINTAKRRQAALLGPDGLLVPDGGISTSTDRAIALDFYPVGLSEWFGPPPAFAQGRGTAQAPQGRGRAAQPQPHGSMIPPRGQGRLY